MVEILVWGDIQPELDRLGIKGTQAYQSTGRRTDISVWALAQDDYQKLLDDPMGEEHWLEAGVGWRHSEGSVFGSPDSLPVVKHHRLLGWTRTTFRPGPYDDLLDYLCDALNVSTETNVATATADLARFNGLSLAGLFAKYQG